MGSRRTHAALRRRAGVALAVWSVAFSLLALAAALPEGPTVVLRVDSPSPLVGQVVHFNASASEEHDEGNGQIVAYRFDFGDGTGTAWQASPTAVHVYVSAGGFTASVTAKDKRGHTGSASVRLFVRALPPPTPDVAPITATMQPERPAEFDRVNLTVYLLNRGTATAVSAAVDAFDERPNGTEAFIGTRLLAVPLPPAVVEPLSFGPFEALGVGNHTLRIVVRDVSPPETTAGSAVLNVTMEVLPSSPPPPPTAPDLWPILAWLDPAHPRIGDSVNLTVLILNRGHAPAESATVTAVDRGPNGSATLVGTVALPATLSPADAEAVRFPPFRANGSGEHILHIVVADVWPSEAAPGAHALDIPMNVTTSVSAPQDHGTGGSAFNFGPLAVALSLAAAASVGGAAFFLLRPSRPVPLEPPAHVPPDRSPPPIWPP